MDGMVVRTLRNPSILQNFPSPKIGVSQTPKKNNDDSLGFSAKLEVGEITLPDGSGRSTMKIHSPGLKEEFFFGEMLNHLEILRH